MGYFPVIDEAGHQLLLVDPRQPGFSPERRDAFAAARRRVWQSVDRELARLLGALDLRATVVVLVSDHGMTPVHTVVDPNVLLQEKGLLAADSRGKVLAKGTAVWTVGSGGAVHVYVAPDRQDLLPALRDLFAGWTVNGEHPVERVYTRHEAAAVHLDHPDSGDLVLFLREGFADGDGDTYGKHGYLSTYPDMHGIYMALGAGVPPGSAGTVRNPEVADRVADWLGIGKPRPSP
jgi:predicted AlkP superfamily pyrophosphatase or phosphodiesterase